MRNVYKPFNAAGCPETTYLLHLQLTPEAIGEIKVIVSFLVPYI